MRADSGAARASATAAAAGVAAVHALAGYGHSFGSATDEGVYTRLALALRHGSYVQPGPFGGIVTDPLPGYPALIAPAVWVLAPHWERLWVLGTAATLACAWLTWRLARRLLTPPAAAATGLLAALAPALVAQSGVVMPDAAFAATCAGAFLVLAADRGGAAAFTALAALGACGALLRPYGVLLPAALAVGTALKRGPRAGAALAALGLSPWLACLARNRLAVGASSVYAANWALQAAAFTPERLAEHAAAAAAIVLGRAAAGVPDVWPAAAAAAAGLLLLAAAARGARRLAAGPQRPVAVALAAFAAGLVAVHLSWRFASPRYGLTLLAPLWIFAAAGVEGAVARARRAAAAAALALGACALAADARLARGAFDRPLPALSRLGAWGRGRLPPDARLESFACAPLELQVGRPVECAMVRDPREAWIVHLLDARIGWVHEVPRWAPDGYLPPGMDEFVAQRQGWLRDRADFEEVFSDPEEGRVFRLRARDEARERAALSSFIKARDALAAHDETRARARLEEVVRLQPRFAYAWAQLALLERDKAKAAALMRRAAAADPASVHVRAGLAALAPPP